MKKIYIKNLIALCYVIEDFEEFNEKLIKENSQQYNRDFTEQLWTISNNNFIIGAKNVKKFYKENKEIIDIINKYSNIKSFINENYNWSGKPKDDFIFFINYIKENKEKIPQILELLNRLKKLGCTKIDFDDKLDFTKEIYELNPIFDNNLTITYVANPKLIPNYLNNISYTTQDSNYKMEFRIIGIRNKVISSYNYSIILNSLTFDPETLPEKIDKETLFDNLYNQKDKHINNNNIVRDTVNINIAFSDLETQVNYTSKIIDNITPKKEMIENLQTIKNSLKALKEFIKLHEEEITTNNPEITKEILKREKQEYIKRRTFSKYD